MNSKWPNLRIEQSGRMFRVVDLDSRFISCEVFYSKKQAKLWAESVYGCSLPWKDLPKEKKPKPKTHGEPRLESREITGTIPEDIDMGELLDFFSNPDGWKIEPRLRKVLELRFGFAGTPKTYRQIGENLSISDGRCKQLVRKALRKVYYTGVSLQFVRQ